MVPIYIMAVLGGIGYYLTSEESNRLNNKKVAKNKKRKIFREEFPKIDMGNGDTIYSQDYLNHASDSLNNILEEKTKDSFNYAKNSASENIVVNSSHQRIKLPFDLEENVENPLEPVAKEWTSISGEKMNKENFIHNNMVHFHSGDPKMVVKDFESNNTLLDLYTGVKRRDPKKEVERFFDYQPNSNNALGRPEIFANDSSRYVPSKYRRNENTIESTMVAPAFRMGTQRIMPKSVDETRSKSNPKVSFEGREQGPKSGISKRGRMGQFFRNKPKKYIDYREQHPTSGPNKKQTSRPTHILRNTNRLISKEYAGVSGSTTQWRGYDKNTFKSGDSKHNFGSTGLRNLKSNDIKRHSDYGKSGMIVKQTLREVINKKNENKTYTGGLVGLVKKITAPIMDILKSTKREEFEINKRAGNVGTLKKNIVYDPNDVAKTTIRETTEVNSYEGNMAPQIPSGLPAYDPDNLTKTTIRETTEVNVHDGNLAPQMAKALPAYDPDNVLKTTIKEMNIDNDYLGQVNLQKSGKQNYLEDKAKSTIRETLPENEKKFLKGMSKHIVYDPSDVARTTIKETTHLTDYVGAVGYKDNRGYLTNPKNPKNTNRIFTTRENFGSYDSSKTGLGYLTNKKTAPNTNRQFTTKDYTGIAGASEGSRKDMSRCNMLNAQIFDLKEKTLIGRKPTQTSVKVASGASNINLQMKRNQLNKFPIGNVNNRQIIPSYDKSSNTTIKNQYHSQIERIDGALLEPYRNNPYSHFINAPKPVK